MSDNIGLLFRCDSDQIATTLAQAQVRHIEKFDAPANCIYVNPESFPQYYDLALACGLRVIQDRTILKNHFWITENVKT